MLRDVSMVRDEPSAPHTMRFSGEGVRPGFPEYREKNREFCKFWARFGRSDGHFTQQSQCLGRDCLFRCKTGSFSPEQGIGSPDREFIVRPCAESHGQNRAQKTGGIGLSQSAIGRYHIMIV